MPSGSRPPIVRTSARLAVGGDGDALDRPLDGLHAAGDLIALEGRPRGAARHDDPTAVGQGDLGVGADVDGQRRRRRAGQTGGRDHGQTVGAHEAGDRRREVHAALGVHGEAELGGAQRHRRRQRRGEGGAAQPDRRDAESQVVHGGVADHRHVVEVARRDRLTLAELAKQLVDASARRPAQIVEASVVDGLREPRDDVFAEAHLGVLERLLVDLPAAVEVEQIGDDLGGADVDGRAVGAAVDIGRLDVDRAPFVAGDRGAKTAVAQRLGQAAQHAERQSAAPPARSAGARCRRARRRASASRARRPRARPPDEARRGAAARSSGSGAAPGWRAPRC